MTPSDGVRAPPAILAERVVKRRGKTLVFGDLNFRASPGATVGIAGSNGSGKTTFLAILAGFVKPHSGHIRLLGCRPGDPQLLGRVGVSLDGAAFPSGACVGEYLTYLARLQGLAACDADAALDTVGALELRPRRFRDLSYGMKRLIYLAQAYVGSPSVMLLDEPTEALDDGSARVVHELLRRRRTLVTTVICSRDHKLITDVCDEVVPLSALDSAGSLARHLVEDDSLVEAPARSNVSSERNRA